MFWGAGNASKLIESCYMNYGYIQVLHTFLVMDHILISFFVCGLLRDILEDV